MRSSRQPKLTRFAQITKERREKQRYAYLKGAYFRMSYNLLRRTDEVRTLQGQLDKATATIFELDTERLKLDAVAQAARKLVDGALEMRPRGSMLVNEADLEALRAALVKAG